MLFGRKKARYMIRVVDNYTQKSVNFVIHGLTKKEILDRLKEAFADVRE